MRGARPMRSTRRLQNLSTGTPKWWSITNKKGVSEPSLVSIYDEIGFFGVSAGDFLAELAGVDGDLDVHINSPGGDVFDAIAIYNTLKARRSTVSVTIDGIAASAASFIAQAASPGHLEMAPFSKMMIHDGFAAAIGNAADMRELADQLDDASDNIASIYAQRTGKPAAYWRAKMRDTTWYGDQEAVDDGLADRVRGNGDVSNAWDLSVFNEASTGNVPLGDGWVCGADGKDRFDPDGDGDDDSTPEGDTDHDYFDASGKQIKQIPACPDHDHDAMSKSGTVGKKASKKVKKHAGKTQNSDVDDTPWDASKAWSNGTKADDPAAFYKGICAGEKSVGDPATQDHWALPYRYTPDSPPNAAGVRNALSRLPQTQDLKNEAEAKDMLVAAMKKINPDYDPGDQLDTELLSVMLGGALRGGKNE